MNNELIWVPLLEAAAQTIIGAAGSVAIGKALGKLNKKRKYSGIMDLWQRGIHHTKLEPDQKITLDCLVSPFSQLFPADPYLNAKKWNSLYSFEGKISKEQYQTLEFFAGSDAALRIDSLNGETLVGLYDRYGFIGEGMIGIAPTKLIRKHFPHFFNPEFIGSRVIVEGRLAKCPTQHGFIAQSIGLKAGIEVDIDSYKGLWYLKLESISKFNNLNDKIFSLLGSPWAVTDKSEQPYIIQYGYLSNPSELTNCTNVIKSSKNWESTQVFFDDISNPDESLRFKNNFLI